MTRTAPALAGLLLLLPVACASAAPDAANPASKESTMPDDVPVTGSFDRNPPKAVPPVARGGKRYAQRLGSPDAGAGQAGGLIDVVDEKTGVTEATIKVYDNKRDSAIEGDAQDIFFTSMAFDAAGTLIVTDETGRRFAVDVQALTVSTLP